MNRAVFLDRDNTIIHNDGDLGDPARVRLVQGAAASIASLCGLGFKIVVITNQGGVARGKYGEEDVKRVHEYIARLVRQSANGARIDRFYFCPYHPEATVERYRREHPNRKPAPGMLLEAARDLKLDLAQCWTVGDQMRDIQAGAAAGTRTILLQADLDPLEPIQKPTGEASHPDAPHAPPDYLARSLIEAVRVIAQARHPESAHDISRAHMAGRRWDAAAVAKLQRPRPKPPREAFSGEDFENKNEPAGEEEGDAPEARHVTAINEGESVSKEEADAPETRQVTAQNKEELVSEEGEIAPVAESSASNSESIAVKPVPSGYFHEQRAQASAPVQPPRSEDEVVGEAAETWDHELPEADSPSMGAGELNQTLRLILQELRHQHGGRAEVSNLYLLAIVLQMVAAVCLLGGLWMGAGDDGLFLRWLAAGLLIQLATIAALLFAR